MNKVKVAEKFFESLSNPVTMRNIFTERLDLSTLKIINDYSGVIYKITSRCPLFSQKDILINAMIIGYLLKGQFDRAELEELLKKD